MMRVSPAATLSLSLTVPLPLASLKTLFSDENFRFKRNVSIDQSFSRRGCLVSEKPNRKWTFSCKCRSRGRNGYAKFDNEGEDIIVVNFNRFVLIRDPEAEIEKHLSFLQDLNIRGQIYLNEQGINAQYSGPSIDALAYVEWLKKDGRFSDLLIQMSPAINGHAFPKLKLQNKPSLVQYEGGISHLPLLDPPMRAKLLEPSEWKRKLKDLTDDDEASSSSMAEAAYYWMSETVMSGMLVIFAGHVDLKLIAVGTLPLGYLMKSFYTIGSSFRPFDKCWQGKDRYIDVLYWRYTLRYIFNSFERGFKNLYTLKGGVSHYLEEEGTSEWVGNLFVFDSRLFLPPAAYNNNAVDTSFARCYLCDSQVQELRHRNCANLDCNRLFLCCEECVYELKGCCCSNCITAPRLRPILHGVKRYEKWHVYRDS